MEEYKNEIYKMALNSVPAQIYWKNTQGVYLGCNEHMAKVFHLNSPDEIVGKTDHDFFLDQERVQAIIENDHKVIHSQQEQVFEEMGTDPDKNLAWYLSKKKPVKGSEGKVIGLIGVSIDITAQKKAESVKREFLSNMSHDLITPLAGVVGLSEVLHIQEGDARKKEMIAMIKESGEVLLKIIHQTLEISNLKHSTIQKIDAFDIKVLLEELVLMIRPALVLKDIKLLLECAPGMIKTDRFKLHRIIFSLLNNAVQFTPKGLIQIRATSDQEKLYISIQDTGIGIAKDQLEDIFTEFYKIKPSYENSLHAGLGNGLYIAKQLANSLNGIIHVESVLGEGSIFTLVLPLSA